MRMTDLAAHVALTRDAFDAQNLHVSQLRRDILCALNAQAARATGRDYSAHNRMAFRLRSEESVLKEAQQAMWQAIRWLRRATMR